MNFLAHFYLCHESEEHVAGSLLGDFVKGSDWQNYPDTIRQAILLHRHIDTLTDHHPVSQAVRERVEPGIRRYSGIMLDMFCDHFLALNWHHFHPMPLPDFSRYVYQSLDRQSYRMPAHAIITVKHMQQHNWLESYQTTEGLQRAFNGLSRRMKRDNPLAESVDTLQLHYADFEQDFFTLMQDLTRHFSHAGDFFGKIQRTKNENLSLTISR